MLVLVVLMGFKEYPDGKLSVTVGWICVITPEYVAAQAFPDEKHDRLEYVDLLGKANSAIRV
jgi:hypothetical protein